MNAKLTYYGISSVLLLMASGSWGAPAVATMTRVQVGGDRTAEVRWAGIPNQVYVIEASTNLNAPSSWVRVATNSTGADGVSVFVDMDAPKFPSRFYRAVLGQPGRFARGMLAKGLITISGGSRLDSFASCDPSYSTSGMYDAAKARAQIKVATLCSATPSVEVGNGKIFGYVDTGASGTVTHDSNGAVGDAGYVNGGSTGFEAGHVSHDMNLSLPDASAPFNSGSAPVLGTFIMNGSNYTSTLQRPTNYVRGNFSMASTSGMIVTNKAVLYVTGSFQISGGAFIYIAPGASLSVYVGTTNKGNHFISISGKGVANGTGNAANFSMVGLPSVKTANYSGSSQFIGTLYSPEADLTMSGGAAGIGAVIASTITLSGGMNFHYDECLGNAGSF
jgi:hypothetical protein